MTLTTARFLLRVSGALLVLLMTTEARAYHGSRTNCVYGRSYLSCTTAGYNPTPNIIHVPPPDAEGLKRIEKWETFCEPRIVERAPDYVRRYVYAHPGCENGRSE